MHPRYDAFVAAFHDHQSRDANDRVFKGVDRALGELPDPSEAESQRRVTGARTLLQQVDAFDPTTLSFDDGLDIELARLVLESEIHDRTLTFNGATHRQQCPTAGDDIGDGIFVLLVNDPRPAAQRLADIMARVESVPDYLAALERRLSVPVARWVDIEIEKIGGVPQIFDAVLSLADSVQWSDAPRLRAASDRACVALHNYGQRLQALPTTADFVVGDATASRIVALRGIDRSLPELHRIAREFLTETRAILDELRRRLAPKYGLPAETTASELDTVLRARYRLELPLDAILRRYEQERELILAFIRGRDLFPIFDEQDMRIIRTPAFMAPTIPAGAMMPPPPFRSGVRTSLIYLTLSEENRDEHTEISIPSMMIHEGIPGHHLQLATAARHPSVIRRHVNASEHAEGWTTMLEDYMLDVGFHSEIGDEIRFCGKRELSRLGARVAIDLFFMTGNRDYLEVGVDCDVSSSDPFVAAGNLLAAVTGFVPGRVQAELNWYSQQRGYPLSYLIGNRMVWDLKAELAVANAGRLDSLALDRRFHDVYLNSGTMPLGFLRRVFVHEGLLAPR